LQKDKYILFVARLVPENGAHLLIRAFKNLNTDLKLVIVGDAPYSKHYKKRLRQESVENIIFTGYTFGEDYTEISRNAYFFVLPSTVSATRPVILDQLGFGNCVLVSNSPGNLEVIGDAGASFDLNDASDLTRKMQDLLGNPEMVDNFRRKSQKRAVEHYTWESVTDQYETYSMSF
jgi:glycosyltransferase involved in cell wall biosynthesis